MGITDLYDWDRLDENDLAHRGAYEPDSITSLDADRAAYIPDDEYTPEELHAQDVAEEYRLEAIADRGAA